MAKKRLKNKEYREDGAEPRNWGKEEKEWMSVIKGGEGIHGGNYTIDD